MISKLEQIANGMISKRKMATEIEWEVLASEQLGEPCEIHAVEWEKGGDPLHICEEVNSQQNTDFIVHAANHAANLARVVLIYHEELKRVLNRVGTFESEICHMRALLKLEACKSIANEALAKAERIFEKESKK